MTKTNSCHTAAERWGLKFSVSFLVTAYTTQKNWTFHPFLKQSPQVKRTNKRPKKINLGHVVEFEFVSNSYRSMLHACKSMESIYGNKGFGVIDLRTWQTGALSGKVLAVVQNESSHSCNAAPCYAAYNTLCKTCIRSVSPREQEFSCFHGWGSCIIEGSNDFASVTQSQTQTEGTFDLPPGSKLPAGSLLGWKKQTFFSMADWNCSITGKIVRPLLMVFVTMKDTILRG